MSVHTGTVIMPLLSQLYRGDKEHTLCFEKLAEPTELFGEHLKTT